MVELVAWVLWPVWGRISIRRRREIIRRWDGPVTTEYREDGTVVLLAHRSRLGASLSRLSNVREFGHPSWVAPAGGRRWACVVDLRPAIAAIEREAAGQ